MSKKTTIFTVFFLLIISFISLTFGLNLTSVKAYDTTTDITINITKRLDDGFPYECYDHVTRNASSEYFRRYGYPSYYITLSSEKADYDSTFYLEWDYNYHDTMGNDNIRCDFDYYSGVLTVTITDVPWYEDDYILFIREDAYGREYGVTPIGIGTDGVHSFVNDGIKIGIDSEDTEIDIYPLNGNLGEYGDSVQSETFSDTATRSIDIVVYKTDEDSGAPLKNVMFDVYEDEKKIGTITTDENGYGIYTHTESITFSTNYYDRGRNIWCQDWYKQKYGEDYPIYLYIEPSNHLSESERIDYLDRKYWSMGGRDTYKYVSDDGHLIYNGRELATALFETTFAEFSEEWKNTPHTYKLIETQTAGRGYTLPEEAFTVYTRR